MTKRERLRRLEVRNAWRDWENFVPPDGWQLVGRGLLVPLPIPEAEWEAAVAAQQAALIATSCITKP